MPTRWQKVNYLVRPNRLNKQLRPLCLERKRVRSIFFAKNADWWTILWEVLGYIYTHFRFRQQFSAEE